MESRFIPNNFEPLFTLAKSNTYVQDTLTDIVTNYPPREVYEPRELAGFWHGPTGLAYLFFYVSNAYPHLKIAGHHALTWAKRYIHGGRDLLHLDPKRCGIGSELLAGHAVRACIMEDLGEVNEFLSYIESVLDGEYPNELLHGRAGTLYLLRLMRHWIPGSAPLLEKAITAVSQKIIAEGPEWVWYGKRYLGAVHGDISIVTQLVLTTPGLAQELETKMLELLDLQHPTGNWPSSVGSKEKISLVQFCHGAPGFVTSLISLRPYFPQLEHRIDSAIEAGRECIWEEGLLRKEPNLCHGILGNAL